MKQRVRLRFIGKETTHTKHYRKIFGGYCELDNVHGSSVQTWLQEHYFYPWPSESGLVWWWWWCSMKLCQQETAWAQLANIKCYIRTAFLIHSYLYSCIHNVLSILYNSCTLSKYVIYAYLTCNWSLILEIKLFKELIILFCFIDLLCFYSSAWVFWWPLICSISWNLELRFFQLNFYSSR